MLCVLSDVFFVTGECLTELKFGIGDGQLQYYLYNWSCAEMQPYQVAVTLNPKIISVERTRQMNRRSTAHH